MISERECFVTEDDRLVEYICSRADNQQGCIIMGKVGRIMPGLSAAFVDIGRKNAGFLPLNEHSFDGAGTLRSGDLIPVQIKREEHGGKGAFLSRDISIAGTYLIIMPMNRTIGVSSKIQDEQMREKLSKSGRKIAADRFGLVMRTCSVGIDETVLSAEAETLFDQWRQIETVMHTAAKGSLLFRKPSEIETAVQEWTARGVDEYVISEHAILKMLPSNESRITEQTEVCNSAVLMQLKTANERTVRLSHGGNLVIDECEALTVIDVNTASDAGSGDGFFRTNLDACGEIAIQVRLRNITGIIIIDMIDLKTDEQREKIISRLEQCFMNDRVKTVIHGFTSLGLIEMTRKRTGLSLQERNRQLLRDRSRTSDTCLGDEMI